MDSTKSASGGALQTVIDTIVAPNAAFERVRTASTWGWALLIAIVVTSAAQYVIAPTAVHAFEGSWPAMVAANPQMAQLTPEQQQHALGMITAFMPYAWLVTIIWVPISVLATTVVLLIFNAIGRGSGTFESLWSAVANIYVPWAAIGGIVLAIIVHMKGESAFNSVQSVQFATPSLAWIVPTANVKVAAFLGSLSVFQIWAAILVYLAMRVTARVSVAPATFAALVVPLAAAIVAAASAR